MLKIISSKMFLRIIAIISILIGILLGYLNGGEVDIPKAENIIKGKQEAIFLKLKRKNTLIIPSKLDF